jgi:hypothetical protein
MSATKAEVAGCVSPQEAAKRLGVSPDVARATFRQVPGVLVLGEGERKTIRIPVDILEAWIEKHRVKG